MLLRILRNVRMRARVYRERGEDSEMHYENFIERNYNCIELYSIATFIYKNIRHNEKSLAF